MEEESKHLKITKELEVSCERFYMLKYSKKIEEKLVEKGLSIRFTSEQSPYTIQLYGENTSLNSFVRKIIQDEEKVIVVEELNDEDVKLLFKLTKYR